MSGKRAKLKRKEAAMKETMKERREEEFYRRMREVADNVIHLEDTGAPGGPQVRVERQTPSITNRSTLKKP